MSMLQLAEDVPGGELAAAAGDVAEGEHQHLSDARSSLGGGGEEMAGGDFGQDGDMPPGEGEAVDMGGSMKSDYSGRMRGYRRGGPSTIFKTSIHMNLVQKPARAYAAKLEATIRDLKRRGYGLYYRAKQETNEDLKELSVKMYEIQAGLKRDMTESIKVQDRKMTAHVEKRLTEI